MREILFRAKEFYDNEWIEGFYVHANEAYGKKVDRHIIIKHGEFENGSYDAWEVKSETVGQYTGLCDKNGKKIFEGDIIKTRKSGTITEKLKGYYGYDSAGYPQKIPGYDGASEYSHSCQIDCYAKVEYDPTNGGFRLNDGNAFIGAICNEVVGNIHDNPELLEVDNG